MAHPVSTRSGLHPCKPGLFDTTGDRRFRGTFSNGQRHGVASWRCLRHIYGLVLALRLSLGSLAGVASGSDCNLRKLLDQGGQVTFCRLEVCCRTSWTHSLALCLPNFTCHVASAHRLRLRRGGLPGWRVRQQARAPAAGADGGAGALRGEICFPGAVASG